MNGRIRAGKIPVTFSAAEESLAFGEMRQRDPVAGMVHNREEVARFQSALNFVVLELAKMIVRDGEGASRFVTIRLSGARSYADADAGAFGGMSRWRANPV